MGSTAVSASQSGTATVVCLMAARTQLLHLFTTTQDQPAAAVQFTDVGSACVTAHVRLHTGDSLCTGLEGSVTTGRGVGLQPLPAAFQGAAQRAAAAQHHSQAGSGATSAGSHDQDAHGRQRSGTAAGCIGWSEDERAAGNAAWLERTSTTPAASLKLVKVRVAHNVSHLVLDHLVVGCASLQHTHITCHAQALLGRYAESMRQAGQVAGIQPGEAWRTALHEAAACGTSQVHRCLTALARLHHLAVT